MLLYLTICVWPEANTTNSIHISISKSWLNRAQYGIVSSLVCDTDIFATFLLYAWQVRGQAGLGFNSWPDDWRFAIQGSLLLRGYCWVVWKIIGPLNNRLEANRIFLSFWNRCRAKSKVRCSSDNYSACLVVICLIMIVLTVERSSIIAKRVQVEAILHSVDEPSLFDYLIRPHR